MKNKNNNFISIMTMFLLLNQRLLFIGYLQFRDIGTYKY